MLDTLRILYLTADSSLYGSNKSLLNLLSSLDIEKENCLIITPVYGDFNKELDKLKIKNTVIKYNWECVQLDNDLFYKIKFLISYLLKEFVNFKAKRLIANTVKRNRINIIHSNSSVISLGFEVAGKLGIKHVWHIREFIKLDHDLTLFRGEKRHFKKIHQSDAIIYVSHSLAKYFAVNGKGSMIYNAVAKRLEAAEPVDKESYFLFCGAVTRNKGLHKAIIAFAEIGETDKKLTLKVAGNFIAQTEYYFYISGLVEKLNLSDRIEFLGYRKDIRGLMNKAAGLLVCSAHEGMGRVTAEAMLYNCLVIGHDDKAGTSELVTHKKTGLLFETKEELVSAMRYAIEEESAVTQIIKQAKEYALNNFTEEVFRKKILSVYENLI